MPHFIARVISNLLIGFFILKFDLLILTWNNVKIRKPTHFGFQP